MNSHNLIAQGLLRAMERPAAPTRLAKIAEQYSAMGDAVLRLSWPKTAATVTPRGEVEVQDVIGGLSPAHAGHMTNIEARVIDEAVKQRLKKKHAEELHKTAVYFMSIEGGPEFIKAAEEEGRELGRQLKRDDPAAAAELVKGAAEFSPLLQTLGRAGATASDLERGIGGAAARTALTRGLITAPAGYAVGRSLGHTPQERDRLGTIGAGVGAAAAGASGLATASGLSKELRTARLLEKATGIPAREAVNMGTSMGRENLIEQGARQVLADRPSKTALDEVAEMSLLGKKSPLPPPPWAEKRADIAVPSTARPSDGAPQVKTAEPLAVEGINPKIPGSLAVFMSKQAGIEQGFLRELPIGRMLGGAAIGATAGNLMAGSDTKHEKQKTMMGALAGAGLGYGTAPAAAKAIGAEAGALGEAAGAANPFGKAATSWGRAPSLAKGRSSFKTTALSAVRNSGINPNVGELMKGNTAELSDNSRRLSRYLQEFGHHHGVKLQGAEEANAMAAQMIHEHVLSRLPHGAAPTPEHLSAMRNMHMGLHGGAPGLYPKVLGDAKYEPLPAGFLNSVGSLGWEPPVEPVAP